MLIGKVLRVNDYGLCEVAIPGDIRSAFTLDQINGYRGESARELGIKAGVEVGLERDEEGRVEVAYLSHQIVAAGN